MVRRDPADPKNSRRARPGARRLAAVHALAQQLHAEGPLRARVAHHHPADGDPTVGDRFRFRRAAIQRSHRTPVRRRGARHRRADRHLSRPSAGRRQGADSPHRAGPARPGGRFPALERHAAAGAEAVFLVARFGAVGRIAQADRAALLDRHRRQIGAGRDQGAARQHRDPRVRAPQRGLCVERGNLPALDVRHLGGVDRRRHHLPAQPDQADPAAGRCRGKLRQGARGAEFPPARGARGAPRGAGFHRDEDARRTRHRTAHGDARRRQSTICARCSRASSWNWR